MKKLYIAMTIAAAALIPALSQRTNNPFVGRWDMTTTAANDKSPRWMEVVEKDGNLQVRVQGRTGNVNPAAAAKRDGGRLIVTVTAAAPARRRPGNRPAAPARPELVWEFTEKGGGLTGMEGRERPAATDGRACAGLAAGRASRVGKSRTACSTARTSRAGWR